MTLEVLVSHANAKKDLHPQIAHAIQDCVVVARDGIMDGGFEDHEVELAINSINDLVKDVHEEFEAFQE